MVPAHVAFELCFLRLEAVDETFFAVEAALPEEPLYAALLSLRANDSGSEKRQWLWIKWNFCKEHEAVALQVDEPSNTKSNCLSGNGQGARSQRSRWTQVAFEKRST